MFWQQKKLCFRSKTWGVKIPTNKKVPVSDIQRAQLQYGRRYSTYPFVYPNIVLIRTYIVTPETHCSYHNQNISRSVSWKILLFTRHPFVFLWFVAPGPAVEIHLEKYVLVFLVCHRKSHSRLDVFCLN